MQALKVMAALCVVLGPAAIRAEEEESSMPPELKNILSGLKYESGTVTIGSKLATGSFGKEFKYLGSRDARTVLEKVWGNPPDPGVLGLIVPASEDLTDEDSWAIVVDYEEDGYVDDKDAAGINYDELLQTMKAGSREANEEREKQGFEPVEVIGWATPPHYDPQEKKLYWAKELKFGENADHTLNYSIRILGRKGVLVLNAVGSMSDLPAIEETTPQLLPRINFVEGNRYQDYQPGVDKLAAYGIGALIAGKLAAKAGLFKLILAFLVASKKLVVVGVLAVLAIVGKLFTRKRSETP